MLAKTLFQQLSVLILDEPARGLDPLPAATCATPCAAGATVFVSSHILSKLAEMDPSLCVMNRGRVLASGTVDQVRHQLCSTERVLTETLLGRREEAAQRISSQPTVDAARIIGEQVVFSFKGSDDAQADLMEVLIRLGIRIHL